MSRVQLALNVDDLDAVVDFHSELFETTPGQAPHQWVDGPSGERWELYTVLADVEMPVGLRTVDPDLGTVCCATTTDDVGVAGVAASACC